ncbi:MAG TPA: hypothetical protein VIH31_01515 [Candidatus Paceibacterota bacterium]
MKKIEVLVPQFMIEIHNEIDGAQKKLAGNGIRLKFLHEKFEEIENQKNGALKGVQKTLDFLKKNNMTDTKVQGKSYTMGQVVIDSFAVQLEALKLGLQSYISELVKA